MHLTRRFLCLETIGCSDGSHYLGKGWQSVCTLQNELLLQLDRNYNQPEWGRCRSLTCVPIRQLLSYLSCSKHNPLV